jgi:hypothetical protein
MRMARGPQKFPEGTEPPRFEVMASVNAVVETVLKSPLHRLMSAKFVLVRYQGDAAATEYTPPLQYADTHHGIVVLVEEPDATTWWHHFTTMGQAQVLLAGTWVPMTAHALLGSNDADAVTPLLRSYATRFPNVVKKLDGATLEERVERAVVVWFRPAA